MNHVNDHIGYLKLVGKTALETLLISRQHHEENSSICNLHSEPVNIFFIFSLGRSGTQFLSRLLNIDPMAVVVHEPLKRDTLEYARSFSDNYSYNEYVGFRIKYIQSHVSHQNIKIYGEVNSVLRRHARAIMANIPNVKGFYLIRDGRDVVRSMMARGSMLNKWFYNKIVPQYDDPYFNTWHTMSQFEKCCWVWASENAILYSQFGPAIKFELLLKNYKYIKLNILDVLHLDISKHIWEKERVIKSENRTRKHTCEPYERWSSEWKNIFWKICGDMMQKHGYCKNERDY